LTVDVGRVGEFIAAARIEMAGWRAVPAAADGVDLVAMRDDRVVRVQVKATSILIGATRYQFSTSRGRDRRVLSRDDCDVVSLVCTDIGRCIFRRVEDVPLKTTTIQLCVMTAEAEAASFQKSFEVTK
jgi:hypothetical protein